MPPTISFSLPQQKERLHFLPSEKEIVKQAGKEELFCQEKKKKHHISFNSPFFEEEPGDAARNADHAINFIHKHDTSEIPIEISSFFFQGRDPEGSRNVSLANYVA